MDCTGKWPGPYWFAVGLGVLLAYVVLMPGLKHLVWVIPFACLLTGMTWFFMEGIFYQHWARPWVFGRHQFHYLTYWSGNLPILTLMVGFVITLLILRRAAMSFLTFLGLGLFLYIYIGLFAVADAICSMHIPTDSFGMNFDVFGFRLGGYYLITVAVSVLSLKIFMQTKIAEPTNMVSQPAIQSAAN